MHGHDSKKGDLRHGHESKKGESLKNWSCKRTILVTDVAQKRGLEAYLLNTFTFFLVLHDQLRGFTWTDQNNGSQAQVKLAKGGLRHV